MANQSRSPTALSSLIHLRLLLILLILIIFQNGVVLGGKNARFHIPDDLDDVVDDEEDDAWKEWGQKKKKVTDDVFDPPPSDLSEMDVARMQDEMMKRHQGPSFGFVKLRLGVKRTPEMITDIAKKWSKVARTGGIEVKFMGVDVSTIMFTLEKGQDTLELKEFILSQPEAYEIKIGDQLFRRPGDPSFDDVFAELHANDYNDENKNDEGRTHLSNDDIEKDEL
ncbi:putative LRP chaperone MESD [Helianthus anomalus]